MKRMLKPIGAALPIVFASVLTFAAQENAPAAKPGDPPNIPMGTQANQPSKPSTEASKQNETSPPGSLQSLDRDGDGQITKAEAKAKGGLPEAFGSADRDKNGSLDAAEFNEALTRLKK